MQFTRSRQLILMKGALLVTALTTVLLIQLRIFDNNLIRNSELLVRDISQQLLATLSPNQEVALVDIDEPSIQQIGPWPWSRQQIEQLAETLIAHGARVVVLDMVLPSPRDRSGDRRLLELALQKKLVLAQVFDYVNRESPILAGLPGGALNKSAAGQVQSVRATGIIANHSGLSQAPCIGNIGFIPDADGKLRSLPLLTSWEQKTYPSLALATLHCLGKSVPLENYDTGIQPLAFQSLPESWSVTSAASLLRDPDRASHKVTFGNRIALIGSSALGLSDRVATPLSPNISGMVVHAAAISELLNNTSHKFSAVWFAIGGLLITLAIGIALSVSLSTLLQMVLLFGLSATWIVAILIGSSQVTSAHLTAPLWGMAFLGLTLFPLQWSLARTQTRAAAKLLSRYVAKPVLRELSRLENFDPLKLRTTKITVLVADMADYSKIAAAQTLETTALITQQFLECLTTPVLELQGTLDRYTGDGLIAFWGAPIESTNQSVPAIMAAKEILKRLDELNVHFEKSGFSPVSARIGIACGDALVGDFGTPFRATYTAVGNCVNIATRLESKAKELGLKIVISQEVAEEIGSANLEDIGTHDIRGIGLMRLYTVRD